MNNQLLDQAHQVPIGTPSADGAAIASHGHSGLSGNARSRRLGPPADAAGDKSKMTTEVLVPEETG
jgi:hypothetical protein